MFGFIRRHTCRHDWERLCDIRKDSAIGEHGYELPRNEDGEVLYVDGSWRRCRKCGEYCLSLGETS